MTVVLLLQTCCNIWLWVNQDIAKMEKKLARGSNINAVWVCESANSSLLDCVVSCECTTMFNYYMVIAIGACRAVWVPGQNLAMPHLMLQLQKAFFCHYTVCYMYVHVYAIAQYRCLCVSGPHDIDSRVTLSMLVMWVLIQNSLPGPAGAYGDCCDHATMQACSNFCHKLGQYLETPSAYLWAMCAPTCYQLRGILAGLDYFCPMDVKIFTLNNTHTHTKKKSSIMQDVVFWFTQWPYLHYNKA